MLLYSRGQRTRTRLAAKQACHAVGGNRPLWWIDASAAMLHRLFQDSLFQDQLFGVLEVPGLGDESVAEPVHVHRVDGASPVRRREAGETGHDDTR